MCVWGTVMWDGVVWCGVMWYGVTWEGEKGCCVLVRYGVAWCDAMQHC